MAEWIGYDAAFAIVLDGDEAKIRRRRIRLDRNNGKAMKWMYDLELAFFTLRYASTCNHVQCSLTPPPNKKKVA